MPDDKDLIIDKATGNFKVIVEVEGYIPEGKTLELASFSDDFSEDFEI